ncbi:hypothetical protein BJX64DRAFT_270149, partial [Aspergillus heterothallicus]
MAVVSWLSQGRLRRSSRSLVFDWETFRARGSLPFLLGRARLRTRIPYRKEPPAASAKRRRSSSVLNPLPASQVLTMGSSSVGV